MALIPQPQHTTIAAIDRHYESKHEHRFQRRLGASQIGKPCERDLWYGFRWAVVPAPPPARMLRLWDTGKREEYRFIADLRNAGVEVHDRDPLTNEQIEFTAIGGHFVDKVDGIGRGLVEAPEKWHVFEYKTHNTKSFKEVVKNGVEKGKPEHFAQVVIGMHLAGIDRGYYLAKNKDTDELYGERIRYKVTDGDKLHLKAQHIIASDRPLSRISADETYYLCKWCDHAPVCHGDAVPVPTCRSCMHATPELDGTDGRWSCAKLGKDLTFEEQVHGCEKHTYIPELLAKWADFVDVEAEDSLIYTNKTNGLTFINGPVGYSSVEIYHAADKRMIGNPDVDAIRKEFDARVVG